MEIIWSPRARTKVREIGDYIAKDAPERAALFEDRLLEAVERLKNFPESGSTVPEDQNYRQVIYQGYRLIYHVRADAVEIVTVISPGQNYAYTFEHREGEDS